MAVGYLFLGCGLTFTAEGYPDRVMPHEGTQDVQNTKLVTWQAQPEGLFSAGRAGDRQ